MTLYRLGLVSEEPSSIEGRTMKTLPWAEEAGAALVRYREEQPSPADLERVDTYQTTPTEMLRNPHLKVRAIENELTHMFRNFVGTIAQILDAETAAKVAYAAGLAHGKRRLSTFFAGQGLTGGVEAMAKWQDSAHAAAGARHTTALFAHYDHEIIEVVRTEDSFGASDQQSPVVNSYFAGFIDGYKSIDPKLSHVEEFWRKRADGVTEFVARFHYLADDS